MLGLLCALVGGSWLGQEQHELADSVIRFHVIANSDSAQDQALKLAVRDRVLEEAQAVYPSQRDPGKCPVRVGEQSDPTGRMPGDRWWRSRAMTTRCPPS